MEYKKRSSLKLLPSFPSGLGFAHDRGFRSILHFLAVLLSCLSFVPLSFGSPQSEKSSDAQNAASSIAGNVSVITGQGQVNSLAAVTAKLSEPSAGSAVQSTLTDDSGRFQFTHLTAGPYRLPVIPDRFKPWIKPTELPQSQP